MPRRRNPNEPAQLDRYHAVLVEFMRHKNNVNYPKEYRFSDQELGTITPDDIYRWMCLKAYQKYDPSPTDRPIHARSSSLLYWKKAISYYMPNGNASWNCLANPPCGNPTKSKEVNDLIRGVRKMETRKQGKKSNADRAMEPSEFEQSIALLEGEQNFDKRHRYTAMLKTQFHFIARGDDIAHLKKENIEQSAEYPWTITGRLRWSKNVLEERDCPKQIILGAGDPRYCVLLALSIFEEGWIERGGGTEGPWLFCDGDGTEFVEVAPGGDSDDDDDDEGDGNRQVDPRKDSIDAVRTKEACSRALRNVFRNQAFVRAPYPEPLGMHSVRKYGTTWPRRRGILKDFIDQRARWKGRRRMQDRYADLALPWLDIKTANALCIGGAVKYKVKEGCGISDQWIAQTVAPGIASQFNSAIAAILGKSLMWAVFDPEISSLVPASIRMRIVAAYNTLGEDARLADDQNPIEKAPLMCYENDGVVVIDEVPNNEPMMAQGAGGQVVGGHDPVGWRNAMYVKVSNLEQRIVVVQNYQASHHNAIESRLRSLEANTSRIALQPVFRPVQGVGVDEDGGGTVGAATLSKCPRNLYVLWQEYQFGLGGRKPARQFTAVERGRVKFKYSRRKIIWGAIDRMVRGGATAQVAIDRIYEVYGRLNVSAMAAAMREDEKRGGHQQLR